MWTLVAALGLAGFAAVRSAVLVDFPVMQPPAVPQGVKSCTHHILTNNFTDFGNPAVVQFTPPTDCGTPGTWSAITLNYTATSNGVQFDRLSAVTFHNVEIWRTSTFEPTEGGIIWMAVKDVSRYSPLFAQSGTLILDCNNIISAELGLTAAYLVTLSVTVFASSPAHPPAIAANTIIPISNLSPNQPNYVSVPPALDLGVQFPQSAVKAFAELYASGNGNEEFWYFNTANEFINDLPPGTSFGNGPLREVRILVDGQVAGAALPWPVIFTGGINPGVWRPICAYGALDQPTYGVDLTPFIPSLTDGNTHNISIDVVSAEANGTINQNWFVSGNIQVFTDPSGKRTTGQILEYSAQPLPATKTTGSLGANGDLNVTVSSTRTISIKSVITPGTGAPVTVQWTQNLHFTNTQNFLDNTFVQNVEQLSTGISLSTHNGVPMVSDNFNFPFVVDFTELSDESGFNLVVDHTFTRTQQPLGPIAVSNTINSQQHGNGTGLVSGGALTFANGTNINNFAFADVRGNTFTRQVEAQDNQILFDHQGGTLSGKPLFGIADINRSSLFPKLARVPGRLSASLSKAGFKP